MSLKELEAWLSAEDTTQGERQALRAAGVDLLCLVKTQGRLAGVIILEPRLFGDPYTAGDQYFLATLALEAGMALERARLYELERQRVADFQELDQLRTGFLATISHQLKTPITSIKASVGMLPEEQELSANASTKRLLASALRGAVRWRSWWETWWTLCGSRAPGWSWTWRP